MLESFSKTSRYVQNFYSDSDVGVMWTQHVRVYPGTTLCCGNNRLKDDRPTKWHMWVLVLKCLCQGQNTHIQKNT